MAFKGTPGAIADAFQNAYRQSREHAQRQRELTQKLAEEQRQFGLLQKLRYSQLSEDQRQANQRNDTTKQWYGNQTLDNYINEQNMPEGLAEQFGIEGIMGSDLAKTTGYSNFAPNKKYYKIPSGLSGLLGRGSGGGGDVNWQYKVDAQGNAIAFNPRTLQTRPLTNNGNPLKAKSSDFAKETESLGKAWGELQSLRPGGTLREVSENEWERVLPDGKIQTLDRSQVSELRKKAFQKVKTATDATAKAYNKENPEFEATYKILLRNSDPSKIDSEVHRVMDGEFSPDAIRMMKELLRKRIF